MTDDIILITKHKFDVDYQIDPLGGKIIVKVKVPGFPSEKEVRLEMTPDTAISLSQGLNANCQFMDMDKEGKND